MDSAELCKKFDEVRELTLKRFEAAETKAAAEKAEQNARLTDIEQRSARRGSAVNGDIGASWGKSVTDAPEFKAFRENGGRGTARVELKVLNTIGSGSTFAGSMIVPDHQREVIGLPNRRFTIRQLLAQGNTVSNSVEYSRETARQLNAGMTAEGTTKPQSDANFALLSTPVKTNAHWILASRQALDDGPALQAQIDSDLRYGLALNEEAELLTGDGTGEHLLGLVPQATAYSGAFVVTGETAIDRLMLAILQSEQALLPATGIVLNFTDWAKIKMLKDGMGRYLIGDPSGATPPMLWNLPVAATPALAANSFLVGNFDMAAMIFDRMGVEVLLSTQDSDNFRKNLVTIRAENRLALAVKRPAALVTGTLP